MRRGLIVVVSCVLGGPLWAQEDPVPSACRPLFSTPAGLTEPGAVEWEAGVQGVSLRDGSRHRNLPLQLNLGVCSWFDLRVAWTGFLSCRDAEGTSVHGGGDPAFGGQALFLTQGNAGVDLGVAYWHKVPRASVSKGLGTGKHDDTLVATVSRGVGRWAFDGNFGANWVGRPEASGRVRQGVVSLAITYALGERWNLSLDTYAVAAMELGPRVVSSILAASYGVREDLTLDVGMEVGLTREAPRWVVNAGLVWRLGKLW